MFGLTASDRVRESLDAAHETQATLNAFTLIDDEGALDRARSLDQTIEGGQYAGPLAGVPIALKDLIDQAGRVTTCGSAFYRVEPAESAPCVIALEDAGGVIVGRTGLHEFAFGFSSENPHWGPVRNPWDPSTSPGGSSGGSAAAVSTGITPIGIGTDTGGSVRVPAALCGTFGLKVTYGRIPLEGVFPLVHSIDTVGPLADSMDNIELAYRAMSGDETPLPASRPMRIGVPEPWCGEAPMESEVAAAFEEAIRRLGESGHEVHPIEMPDAFPSRQMWHAIAQEVRSVHREFRERGEPYGDDVAERLDDAEKVTEDEISEAATWQKMIRARFDDAFQVVDLLITPTVPVRRKEIGVNELLGRHYRAVLSYFSALVNHALHPGLAVPLADSGTPPASLQVIGPLLDEPTLIGFGKHLESVGIAEFRLATTRSASTGHE